MTDELGLSAARRDAYISRYRTTEWRAAIFADMVLDDLRDRGPASTVVDIGCGSGFDGAVELQARIAQHCRNYVGVEPDCTIRQADYFSAVHRSAFETAPIAENSVDLAFCVMVVEHVSDPQGFMNKAAEILKDAGVFWAFTVDRRHWSAWSSFVLEKSGLKNSYLTALHGRRGEQRYANYPVYYRLNSPSDVRRYARDFRSIDLLSLGRVGAEDYNLPRIVHPLNHIVDHLLDWSGAPGSNLAFRLVRNNRSGSSLRSRQS